MIGPKVKEAVEIKESVIERFKEVTEKRLKLLEEQDVTLWWLQHIDSEIDDVVKNLEDLQKFIDKEISLQKEIQFNFWVDERDVLHGESTNGFWLWNNLKSQIFLAFNSLESAPKFYQLAKIFQEDQEAVARVAYEQGMKFVKENFGNNSAKK